MRLFVAVGLPAPARACVNAVIDEWRTKLTGARWVPAGNQHITLKFLGWTDPSRLPDVQASCRGVAATLAPAALRPAGLGVFPGARRARVLWVGLEDESRLLARAAAGIEAALAPLGWSLEERAFHAHVTVARFPSPQPVKGLTGAEDLGCEPFVVDHLTLWQSHLSPRGPRYEALDDFPLGTPAAAP